MTTQPYHLPSLPIEFQNESGYRLARNTVYTVAATLFALGVWASIAPIEEASIAIGKIVPALAISEIQHLEGGIVESVYAVEGQPVKRGQILVRLRPEQTSGDLSQLEARIAHLRLKWIRLNASLLGREPDFDTAGERFPGLQREQKETFDKEAAQARASQDQLKFTIQRVSEQLKSALSEITSLKTQVALYAEQAAIREKSHAKGYTSRYSMLQAKSIYEEAQQRLIMANGKVAELTKTLEESRTKLQETIASRARALVEERAETASQLAEMEKNLTKFRDRVERLEVVSPIDGVIQSLAANAPGEVVKPGDLVAQVIPAKGTVLAEVELAPRDIGHVRVGYPAEITLSNYDVTAVGVIGGKVEMISATTFENEQGQPFYRVRITLDRQHLTLKDGNLPISPGTTLRAQILTGEKSLMRYMLKPIYRSFETAFTER